MSLPGYRDYKESGVPWLGSVPAGWAVVPLKHAARVFPSNVDKHSHDDEIPVLLCNYTDVYYNDRVGRHLDFMEATATAEEIRKFTLQQGDTIITKDSETADDIGRSAYVSESMPGVLCGYHLSVIRPNHRVEGRFIKRIFDSSYLKAVMEVSANGLTRVGLGQYAIDNLYIPLPPLEDQVRIADFLEDETAKIDALIAKQEQLIATLREDRTATITHAVTKGIDPNVAVVESGVSWIGRIPALWSVPQLGMLAAVGNGSTPSREEPRYWFGGTVPWLNSSHVNREQITDADQFVTDAALLECHLPIVKRNSVLVGLTGQGKTRGMASLLNIRSTINQHLAYVSPIDGQLDTRFLQRVLTSAYGLLRELSDENGSTKGGLTCAALRKVRVPLPPVVEQVAIADYLDSRCAVLDALIAKAGQVIDALLEYRAALITDAVTGKIDVRGVA